MPLMFPTFLHNLLGHQLKSSKPVVNATLVKPAPASWPQNTSHRWHNPHTLAPAHTVGMRGHEKVFFCQKLCQQSAGLFYQAENLPSICRSWHWQEFPCTQDFKSETWCQELARNVSATRRSHRESVSADTIPLERMRIDNTIPLVISPCKRGKKNQVK